MRTSDGPSFLTEPMHEALRGGKVLALQLVHSWAAVEAKHKPTEVAGLRSTMDYCARLLEAIDPDGSIRERLRGCGEERHSPAILTFPNITRLSRPQKPRGNPR
jgi:hypothetical protein